MLTYRITVIALAAAITAGCASGAQQSATTKSLPDWVTAPYVKDGFTDTQCVKANASMGILKNSATALGRAEIAKQIDVQVKAMDKTYARKVKTADGISTGGVFETVSKQVTNRNLTASQVNKVDVVQINNADHLCAMVVFGREANRRLFDDLINTTQVAQQISPQDEGVLWEEFKAYKSQQELDKETQ